jgi:Family of unknown function (DUF5317)
VAYAVVAIVLGGVLGLATGGRLQNLGEHRLAAWWIMPVGIVLQLLGARLNDGNSDTAFALLLASYLALGAFTLANWRIFGMAAVAVGLGLNLLVIAVNEGMPVRRAAVVDAGIAASDNELSTIKLKSKHHYETAEDSLMPLADVIPVRPLREVLSVGDVVMSIGIAAAIATLLRKEPAHPQPQATRSLPSEG